MADPDNTQTSPARTWVSFDEDGMDRSGLAEASEEDVEQLNTSSKRSTATPAVLNIEGATIDATQVEIVVEKNKSKQTVENGKQSSSQSSSPVKLDPPPKTKKNEAKKGANLDKTENRNNNNVNSSVNPSSPSGSSSAASPANKLANTQRFTNRAAGAAPPPSEALQHVPLDGKVTPEPLENGQLIVTRSPDNMKCPWVTPATFDPCVVPPELMTSNLTLTADDYEMSMDFLVNDVRFNCYTVCYRRIIVLWLLVGFAVLLGVLFSGERKLAIVGLGFAWLIINACGIVFCLYVKSKINKNLEIAVASVNRILMKHKILLGMDDVGRVSCHKICLHFIYFDGSECLATIDGLLRERERKLAREANRKSHAAASSQLPAVERNTVNQESNTDDVAISVEDSTDIIGKHSATNISNLKTLEKAEHILLRYSQLYVKNLIRGLLQLRFEVPEGIEAHRARHCKTTYCLCQFVEQNYFRRQPTKWYASFV